MPAQILRPALRRTALLLSSPAILSSLLLAPAQAQTAPAILPPGTPLVMRIDNNVPMRAGHPISARLIYPIYSDNHIVVPEQSVLNGTVVSLRPNRARRIRASLGGDLTPFHIPVVHFTDLVLPDGTHIAVDTSASTDGAPIYRAVAPPPVKGGIVRQALDSGLAVARTDVALFTAPGKVDRVTQFVYNRLPYHPERIEKGTAWTTETVASVSLPAQPAPPSAPPTPALPKLHFWQQPTPVQAPPDTDPGHWTIQAYLAEPLSSESSKAGQPIRATVASPILNTDGTVAIPQGSTLVGTIAKAQPARRFGRTGVLSFNFRQLTLPGGQPQNVQTTLTGADSAQDLALNSEGQVKSKPKDRISVPIILAFLSSRPLDRDRGKGENQTAKNASGGAAGLGLVGTIISVSGISPNAASGIGYYGTALSIYDRWIARGKKVEFPRDTRIVVQTVPRRSAAIHADPSRSEDLPQNPKP